MLQLQVLQYSSRHAGNSHWNGYLRSYKMNGEHRRRLHLKVEVIFLEVRWSWQPTSPMSKVIYAFLAWYKFSKLRFCPSFICKRLLFRERFSHPNRLFPQPVRYILRIWAYAVFNVDIFSNSAKFYRSWVSRFENWNFPTGHGHAFKLTDLSSKVLCIFRRDRCSVDLNRPVPCSSMLIRLTRFGAPEPNQGCSGGGWEKRGQEKSKNDASKKLSSRTWKKPELSSSKVKDGHFVTDARWCIGMKVDVVNVQSLFAIFSLVVHFFRFQNKVVHGERSIFAYEYVVRLQRWRGNTDDLDVSLTEMRPAHHGQTGNAVQEW